MFANACQFTRFLLIIVLLTTALGPGANTVRADGTPWIQVFYNPDPDPNMMEASIFGRNWPLGAAITLSIDDPETPQAPDYTAVATARALDQPGDNGTIAEFWLLGVFPLRAGMLATLADDPLTASRQVVVSDPRVTLFRYSNDTVAGTAAPHSIVEISNVYDASYNYAQRRVTVDANGDWLADFAHSGEDDDERTTIGLEPGQQAFVCQLEPDGDQSCKSWAYSSIRMYANLTRNRVTAWQWERDATVTLTLDDPSTPALPDYTAEGQMYVRDPAYPLDTAFDFNLPPGIYLKAGLVATVGDGYYTHTLTVQDFGLTRVDVDANVVTGTAAAGVLVNVMVWYDDPNTVDNPDTDALRQNIETGLDGVWTADFSVPGPNEGEAVYDLMAEDSGRGDIYDEDGDRTRISWPISRGCGGLQCIMVQFPNNNVTGRGWPVGAAVTLTIDDPATPQPIDYRKTKTVGADESSTRVDFKAVPYLLNPGDIVRLTDGAIARELVVFDVWIGHIDTVADTVSGAGYPLTRVDVGATCDNVHDFSRYIYTDAAGNWSADFSTPGPTPDQPALDLTSACYFSADQNDIDGDRVRWITTQGSPPANSYTRAQLTQNIVWVNAWPVGVTASLTIEDPTTPQSPDFSMQQFATPGFSRLNFDLRDLFDLKAGQQAILTDGVHTLTWTFPDIAVTGLDAAQELVSGAALPGATVAVCPSDSVRVLEVQADASGAWTADLGSIGYDLQPGSYGEAIALTPDDLGASVGWHLGWTAPGPEILVVGVDSMATLDLAVPSFFSLQGHLQEPLFEARLSGVLEPSAALGYTVSADGLVYTVSLRPEAHWSDGAPVTAQHFVDGFLYILDPANESDFAYMLYPIAGAEDYNTGGTTDPDTVGVHALGPQTLQITLHDPAVNFPQILSLNNILPVRSDLIALYGDEWAQAGKFASNGPYSLVERDGAHLRLAPNPYYHSPEKVAFSDVVLTQMPWEPDRLEAFAQENVDVLLGLSWYGAAYTDPDLSAAIRPYPAEGMHALGLNHLRAPTDNLLVRKALALAIDDQALLNGLPPGKYLQPAGGVIPPSIVGYQEVVGYAYNPSLARQYLADAGYPGGAGFPEITLVGRTFYDDWLEEVARQWRVELNIPVSVVTHGRVPRYLRDCASSSGLCDFHAVTMNWALDHSDALNMLSDYFHPDAGFNAGGWDSARYRELMDLIAAETDPEQRLDYIHEAERILVQDDLAVIPLFFTHGAALVRPGIYLDSPGFYQSVARWGASDVDGDGLHDLLDPCPADPQDTCSPDGSTAGVIGAAGGELHTSDGSAALAIPAGTMDEPVTFSITATGNGYQLVTDEGPSLVAASAQIEPSGTAFAQPATITLRWPDENDDGIVDGLNLVEAALVAVKDGHVVGAPCALDPGCDMDANIFFFQVSGLSNFALAGLLAPKIASIAGAGWYRSPPGAYLADPEAQGRVQFNMLFRYIAKGRPFGHFYLRFKDANLNFDDSGLEWLVAAENGAEAVFKAHGRVNNRLAPNRTPYHVMVWMTAGRPDWLRVKIWWQDASGVHLVYDTLALQPLTQGQIIIHTR